MILSHSETVFLYISVMVFATIFAYLSECKKIKNNFLSLLFYLFSFLIMWIFLFFSNTGPDYENYSLLISRLSWNNYASFSDQEPFFNVVLLILMGISNNSIPLTIGLTKTISLLIVFVSFFLIRNKVMLWFSVLCYSLFCYLPSFYLLPMILAASLVLLANSLLIRYKRKIIPILLVLLAAQIHNSAYLFLIVFLLSILYLIKPNLIVLFNCCLVIVYLASFIFSRDIFTFASNKIVGFHYTLYASEFSANTGFLWIVMYVPLFIIAFLSFKFQRIDRIISLLFLYCATSALIKMLSYNFSVIGRLEFLLISIYCLFLSRCMFLNKTLKESKMAYIFAFVVLTYVAFRGILSFVSEMNWMDGYHFINPFLS